VCVYVCVQHWILSSELATGPEGEWVGGAGGCEMLYRYIIAQIEMMSAVHP